MGIRLSIAVATVAMALGCHLETSPLASGASDMRGASSSSWESASAVADDSDGLFDNPPRAPGMVGMAGQGGAEVADGGSARLAPGATAGSMAFDKPQLAPDAGPAVFESGGAATGGAAGQGLAIDAGDVLTDAGPSATADGGQRGDNASDAASPRATDTFRDAHSPLTAGARFAPCAITADCDADLVCTATQVPGVASAPGYCTSLCDPTLVDPCAAPDGASVGIECVGIVCLLQSCQRASCPEALTCTRSALSLVPGQTLETFECTPQG